MSEASEKVLGLEKLAIFPLPMVLMPYELVPLHIFEPRYRKLLSDIEVSKNMFGITLFEPRSNTDERPSVGSIGCVAEVREKQILEDGRSNILTIGVIRYRIVEYVDIEEEYLVAKVEFFEDEADDLQVLDPLANEVFELFKRVAVAAHKLSGQQGGVPEIPEAEPEQLSFLVSAAINLENPAKYKILETRSTSERLHKIRGILKESVDQMEESAHINKISRTNGHAKKKIDLDL